MWLDQSPRGHSIRDLVGNPCELRLQGQSQSQVLDVFGEMTNYAAPQVCIYLDELQEELPVTCIALVSLH